MKKEIEVYLPPNFNESNGSIHLTRAKCRDSGAKATLIFNVPEKSIKLTESEFDEAWERARLSSPRGSEVFEHFKEKLFNKE